MLIKRITLYVIFITIIFSCEKSIDNDSSQGNFIIKVKVDAVTDNTKIVLKKQENNAPVTIDSTIIKNGFFEFKGKIEKPIIYGIYIDNVKGAIGVFMENKTITIEAYKDSLASSKISGSKTNDDYLGYIKQSNRIISKMNVLFPAFQKARAENDVEKLNEINKKMQEISSNNTAFTLDYAKQHPDSYISALALHSVIRIPTIEKDTIAKIYNNFSDYVKKGDFAIKTKIFLETVTIQDTIQN